MGIFPSVALAWRMEQEKNFIKENASWIDQLKLRLGYGQTGNQSIDPYNSFYNYKRQSTMRMPVEIKTGFGC